MTNKTRGYTAYERRAIRAQYLGKLRVELPLFKKRKRPAPYVEQVGFLLKHKQNLQRTLCEMRDNPNQHTEKDKKQSRDSYEATFRALKLVLKGMPSNEHQFLRRRVTAALKGMIHFVEIENEISNSKTSSQTLGKKL